MRAQPAASVEARAPAAARHATLGRSAHHGLLQRRARSRRRRRTQLEGGTPLDGGYEGRGAEAGHGIVWHGALRMRARAQLASGVYNERPYDERGWCVFEDAVSHELLARLGAAPRVREALDALPSKVFVLRSGRRFRVV